MFPKFVVTSWIINQSLQDFCCILSNNPLINIWRFPKIAGWFITENEIKMDDDWGYPLFRKPHETSIQWNILIHPSFTYWRLVGGEMDEQKNSYDEMDHSPILNTSKFRIRPISILIDYPDVSIIEWQYFVECLQFTHQLRQIFNRFAKFLPVSQSCQYFADICL